MSILLTFPPDELADWERRASSAGIDLTSFIRNAVRESLEEADVVEHEGVSYEQWRSEFRTWVAAQRSRNPRFDDSRESIYR